MQDGLSVLDEIGREPTQRSRFALRTLLRFRGLLERFLRHVRDENWVDGISTDGASRRASVGHMQIKYLLSLLTDNYGYMRIPDQRCN